jgi:hypothetical protein
MPDSSEYIKQLKNSKSWLTYYQQQKFIADVLLERILSSEEIINDIEDSNFITLFVNAHYHWGIAIENGLKGLII